MRIYIIRKLTVREFHDRLRGLISVREVVALMESGTLRTVRVGGWRRIVTRHLVRNRGRLVRQQGIADTCPKRGRQDLTILNDPHRNTNTLATNEGVCEIRRIADSRPHSHWPQTEAESVGTMIVSRATHPVNPAWPEFVYASLAIEVKA